MSKKASSVTAFFGSPSSSLQPVIGLVVTLPFASVSSRKPVKKNVGLKELVVLLMAKISLTGTGSPPISH